MTGTAARRIYLNETFETLMLRWDLLRLPCEGEKKVSSKIVEYTKSKQCQETSRPVSMYRQTVMRLCICCAAILIIIEIEKQRFSPDRAGPDR
jgi:hypothetical protein